MSKIYLPDLIRPREVQQVLCELGIRWNAHKVNPTGWVVIRSPFREDNHPSFSLNVRKGCFKDFATGEGGDLVKLIRRATKMRKRDVEQYLKQKFNIRY